MMTPDTIRLKADLDYQIDSCHTYLALMEQDIARDGKDSKSAQWWGRYMEKALAKADAANERLQSARYQEAETQRMQLAEERRQEVDDAFFDILDETDDMVAIARNQVAAVMRRLQR